MWYMTMCYTHVHPHKSQCAGLQCLAHLQYLDIQMGTVGRSGTLLRLFKVCTSSRVSAVCCSLCACSLWGYAAELLESTLVLLQALIACRRLTWLQVADWRSDGQLVWESPGPPVLTALLTRT
jgi:hypothetical protein